MYAYAPFNPADSQLEDRFMSRTDGGEIVWRPSQDLIAQSNLTRFMKAHGLQSLDDLQRRSTEDISWFWASVLEDVDVRFRKPYSRVVDLSRGMAWPKWCVGGVMNI